MYLLYMFQYFSFIYIVSSMIKIINEKDNHVSNIFWKFSDTFGVRTSF